MSVNNLTFSTILTFAQSMLQFDVPPETVKAFVSKNSQVQLHDGDELQYMLECNVEAMIASKDSKLFEDTPPVASTGQQETDRDGKAGLKQTRSRAKGNCESRDGAAASPIPTSGFASSPSTVSSGGATRKRTSAVDAGNAEPLKPAPRRKPPPAPVEAGDAGPSKPPKRGAPLDPPPQAPAAGGEQRPNSRILTDEV